MRMPTSSSPAAAVNRLPSPPSKSGPDGADGDTEATTPSPPPVSPAGRPRRPRGSAVGPPFALWEGAVASNPGGAVGPEARTPGPPYAKDPGGRIRGHRNPVFDRWRSADAATSSGAGVRRRGPRAGNGPGLGPEAAGPPGPDIAGEGAADPPPGPVRRLAAYFESASSPSPSAPRGSGTSAPRDGTVADRRSSEELATERDGDVPADEVLADLRLEGGGGSAALTSRDLRDAVDELVRQGEPSFSPRLSLSSFSPRAAKMPVSGNSHLSSLLLLPLFIFAQ